VTALPPPSWPISDEDGKVTQPWYGYLKAADDTWRPSVVEITTATTAANSAAHVLANSGVTYFNFVTGALTTDWVLELPEPGVRKTIAVGTTSTTLVITLPNTVARFRGTGVADGWKVTFPSSLGFKVLDLIGVTTARYYITSNPSSAVVTT
jgi:hypothetical protein